MELITKEEHETFIDHIKLNKFNLLTFKANGANCSININLLMEDKMEKARKSTEIYQDIDIDINKKSYVKVLTYCGTMIHSLDYGQTWFKLESQRESNYH